jgi:hypothetical protein
MAKAEKVLEPKYLLTLDRNEAQFICDVMVLIGGDLIRSRRKHASELLQILGNLGVVYSNGRMCDVHESYRSIWFENEAVNGH